MYQFGKREIEAVTRILQSKQLFRYKYNQKSETDKFEAEWAKRMDQKHALATTSGTAALICGLAGLEIGPGDEVIVPAYTFIATALAPLAVGAVPVVAEIDATLSLDPEDIKRKITPRTRAIIPVHMNGLACDMKAICSIAAEHNLVILEDVAQAHGGSFQGRLLGSFGEAAAFSFNQYKILTCGEGGALVTNSLEVHQRAFIFHDCSCAFREGEELPSVPLFAGLNFRVSEISAAILRVQIPRLDQILEDLRQEKDLIREALGKIDGLTLSPSNDPAGECGTAVAMLFDSEPIARRIVDLLRKRNISASCEIDSGRHVFTNWKPILGQRNAHHPARGPAHETPAIALSPETCPNSLDILSRTVLVRTEGGREEPAIHRWIEGLVSGIKAGLTIKHAI